MWMILVGIICIMLYLLRREYLSQTRKHRELGNKIPGPKPLPIIGNALEFGFSTKAIFEYMNWLPKEYGQVSRAWIGPNLIIVLADPLHAELLLGDTKNMNKSSLYRFGESFLGKGLITNDGELWKKHRKIVAPPFRSQILSKSVEVFNSHLEVLIEKLFKHQNGPDFNIFPYINLFTLDVICESAMGVKVNAQLNSESEYVKGLQCLEEITIMRGSKPWLHPDILYSLSSLGRKQKKHLPVVLNMTKRVIHERQQMKSAGREGKNRHEAEEERGGQARAVLCSFMFPAYVSERRVASSLLFKGMPGYKRTFTVLCSYLRVFSSWFRSDKVAWPSVVRVRSYSQTGVMKTWAFLDYLIDETENGVQLTNQELEDEVNTIVIAGHDTTTCSISYTCWLPAKHQDIQEKVFEELKTIFGDSLRHCTLQDLTEMKYLEQVVKESLRILPPVPAFGRKLSEDIKTDKYTFPAGCEIGVNVYMLHRHPDYFPDPEKFDPDRFLPENCVGRHPYCYLPFGGGPRTCLGYKYAIQEMKTTVAYILRHFKILPPENPFYDLDLTLKIVIKSRTGVRIRLEPRSR